MKWLASIFVLILGFSALAYRVEDEAIALYEVNSHIRWFMQNRNPRLQQRALTFAPSVVHWSKKYSIDPLLTSLIITRESSYLPDQTGSIGEIGLMQVHSPRCKKGFDLTKEDDQIHAGVKCLRYCFDECNGRLDLAMTKYATGGCYKRYRNLKHWLKQYRKIIQLHRKPIPEALIEEIDIAISRAE